MNATVRKLILTALAALASSATLADDRSVFRAGIIGPIAELGAEGQVWSRERWMQMLPGERDALRQKLRQEWNNLPPEARPQRMEELVNRPEDRREKPRQRGPERYESETGYGQGYGSRPWDGQNGDNEGRHGRRY